jgi:hypothetical protein
MDDDFPDIEACLESFDQYNFNSYNFDDDSTQNHSEEHIENVFKVQSDENCIQIVPTFVPIDVTVQESCKRTRNRGPPSAALKAEQNKIRQQRLRDRRNQQIEQMQANINFLYGEVQRLTQEVNYLRTQIPTNNLN